MPSQSHAEIIPMSSLIVVPAMEHSEQKGASELVWLFILQRVYSPSLS